MGKYRTKWAPEAIIDKKDIRRYLAEQALAPNAAYNIIKAIHEAVADIASMPYMWPLVYDLGNNLIPPGYRKCVVKNYVIVYLVYEETELASPENKNLVGVIRIFHGRQDWLGRLASP
jgi:plasmid stabilization system protein ParE